MTAANRRQSPPGAGHPRYLPPIGGVGLGHYRQPEIGARLRSYVLRTCAGCGSAFAAGRVHARWCSDRCRKAGRR